MNMKKTGSGVIVCLLFLFLASFSYASSVHSTESGNQGAAATCNEDNLKHCRLQVTFDPVSSAMSYSLEDKSTNQIVKREEDVNYSVVTRLTSQMPYEDVTLN